MSFLFSKDLQIDQSPVVSAPYTKHHPSKHVIFGIQNRASQVPHRRRCYTADVRKLPSSSCGSKSSNLFFIVKYFPEHTVKTPQIRQKKGQNRRVEPVKVSETVPGVESNVSHFRHQCVSNIIEAV